MQRSPQGVRYAIEKKIGSFEMIDASVGITEIRQGDKNRPILYLSGLGAKTIEFAALAAKTRGTRTILGVEISDLDLSILRNM